MTEQLLLLVAQVNRCINGELSIHDFERWFVPWSWNNHRWPDRQTSFVTDQVGGPLCVAGVEGWTDEELFDEWRLAIANLPECLTRGGQSVTLPTPTGTTSSAASWTWQVTA